LTNEHLKLVLEAIFYGMCNVSGLDAVLIAALKGSQNGHEKFCFKDAIQFEAG
jgi:hypothetical protein